MGNRRTLLLFAVLCFFGREAHASHAVDVMSRNAREIATALPAITKDDVETLDKIKQQAKDSIASVKGLEEEDLKTILYASERFLTPGKIDEKNLQKWRKNAPFSFEIVPSVGFQYGEKISTIKLGDSREAYDFAMVCAELYHWSAQFAKEFVANKGDRLKAAKAVQENFKAAKSIFKGDAPKGLSLGMAIHFREIKSKLNSDKPKDLVDGIAKVFRNMDAAKKAKIFIE